jgi:hypothetical protein
VHTHSFEPAKLVKLVNFQGKRFLKSGSSDIVCNADILLCMANAIYQCGHLTMPWSWLEPLQI